MVPGDKGKNRMMEFLSPKNSFQGDLVRELDFCLQCVNRYNGSMVKIYRSTGEVSDQSSVGIRAQWKRKDGMGV